jgi:hypothetical protein
MPLQHGIGGLDNRGIRCDGNHRPGHDLVGAHGEPLELGIGIDRLSQPARSDLTQVNYGICQLDAAQCEPRNATYRKDKAGG